MYPGWDSRTHDLPSVLLQLPKILNNFTYFFHANPGLTLSTFYVLISTLEIWDVPVSTKILIQAFFSPFRSENIPA